MVKPATFDSNGMKKGAWSKHEDDRLRDYVMLHGHDNWRLLPSLAGLARCGKSCRLRWVNYLKPGLKREKFTKQDEEIIIKLHNQLGNKWSAIAAKFPGRTDNEIKNYWHAHIKKRGRRGKIFNKAQTDPQEFAEVSSSSSSTVTTDDQHQEESPVNDIDDLSPITDLDAFARAQEDLLITGLTQQTCFSQINDAHLPPFSVEEFHDFESLFQEMQNDLLDNSSDGGSSSNTTAEFQGDLWSEAFGEECIFDMELW